MGQVTHRPLTNLLAALGVVASLTLIRRDELEVEVVSERQVEPALDAA